MQDDTNTNPADSTISDQEARDFLEVLQKLQNIKTKKRRRNNQPENYYQQEITDPRFMTRRQKSCYKMGAKIINGEFFPQWGDAREVLLQKISEITETDAPETK